MGVDPDVALADFASLGLNEAVPVAAAHRRGLETLMSRAAEHLPPAQEDEDGDRMPDMTGIMSSYDNFPMYGLSSYIQSQWLAAMKSMTVAARVMEDEPARKLYESLEADKQ